MISLLILAVLLLLFLIYLLLLGGRVGFADFSEFKKQPIAHRGLYGNGIPENSLWAFKNAIEHGFGAELDVHLTKDGKLVVIHDSSLLRTAGSDVCVEDLTLTEIKQYNLENTQEKIPEFSEVLNLFEGNYPLIVEIKSTEKSYAELCLKTAEMLRNHNVTYCIESFDPRCVRWFYKNRPNVIRGQLSTNFLKSKNMGFAKKFALSFLITNFLTKPDFVAFNFSWRRFLSFRLATGLLKIQGVGWTIRTPDDIKTAQNENIIPIFEDR